MRLADLRAQRGAELARGDALLPHGVAVADGHRLVFQALEVDGDAERGADLVLAAVAASDRSGVVELDHPVLAQGVGDLAATLRRNWNVEFDDAGAIGRRYRRQDEIGTPFCITVDFDTLDDQAVTIRERDTMAQERVALDKVEGWMAQRLVGA